MTYYYRFPFGTAGDLTAIPPDAQPDGSVSYEDGWTEDYQLDLIADPTNARPIPRAQTNQLFKDITENIQQYQQFGVPNFITALDNGGMAFEYPIFAVTRYAGQIYENQVPDNTALPGTDDTWLLLSGGAQGVPTGTVIDFDGTVAPSGYIFCDGSQISRTTYSRLFNVLTFIVNGTTTNTSTTVTGLSSTNNMYIGMAIEGANIPAGTTIASIDTMANTIVMSQAANNSGAIDITFFPHGNGDGTTTFNVSDRRRRTSIGRGGTGTTVIGSNVGQKGGVESATIGISHMPSHNHPGSTAQVQSGFFSGSATQIPDPSGTGGIFNLPVTVAPQGDGQAFSVMQPSIVSYMCIKT